MNPHKSKHIKIVKLENVDTSLYRHVSTSPGHIKYKKKDMLYIFLMWIPNYIDMNPHFSQNILYKGIFKMWIHRYIDMYPYCLGIKYKKGDMLYIF